MVARFSACACSCLRIGFVGAVESVLIWREVGMSAPFPSGALLPSLMPQRLRFETPLWVICTSRCLPTATIWKRHGALQATLSEQRRARRSAGNGESPCESQARYGGGV